MGVAYCDFMYGIKWIKIQKFNFEFWLIRFTYITGFLISFHSIPRIESQHVIWHRRGKRSCFTVDTSSIDTATPSYPSTELKSVPCRSCGVHASLRRITRLVSQDNNLCPVIYRTRAACLLPATYYLPICLRQIGSCRYMLYLHTYIMLCEN